MNRTAAPDWSRIDTVLLDMDGTLLDLDFDLYFWRDRVPRHYAERHGVSVEQASATLKPVFERSFGSLDFYCIDHWSRELGLDIAALKRGVRHEVAWLPRAREFVASLRAAGRRAVLVTNAHPETLAIKDAHLGIRREFDAVYCSHEFGQPKESADFWPALARAEPFERRRTMFVDDSLPVLRAAKAYGIGWVYAVRKPASRAPMRDVSDFLTVESVAELAAGLRPGATGAQPPDGA